MYFYKGKGVTLFFRVSFFFWGYCVQNSGLRSALTLQWTGGSAATKLFHLAKVYVLLAAHKGLVSRLHSEQGQPDKWTDSPFVLNTNQKEGK